MGTYKVIQDIEAEDKLLGPLTLKQFIFAGISMVLLYLGVFALTKGTPILLIIFFPFIAFFGFMAWPFMKDQPTETWLLAKLRFMFKPRKRIWDQAGIKDLVTITAPKRIEKVYTDGLSQTEVRSRLKALANTIDSRGWAVKNIDVNLFNQPSYIANQSSDRLLDASSLPQDVANYEITASDDMMDEQNNPAALALNQMMVASAQTHRQDVLSKLQQPTTLPSVVQNNPQAGPAADYWFMNQPAAPPVGGLATFDSKVVVPGSDPAQAAVSSSAPAQPTVDEEALLEKLRNEKKNSAPRYGHMRNIHPLSEQATSGSANNQSSQPPAQTVNNTPPVASSPTSSPAILNLANNDDLNVETIARQAKKAQDEPPADEVVISLR